MRLTIVTFVLFAVSAVSGCTHTRISDPNLLVPRSPKASEEISRVLPINIVADQVCSYSTVGVMYGTQTTESCSNAKHIYELADAFGERGIKIVPANDSIAPQMSVRTKDFNGFLQGTSAVFCVLTWGFFPIYGHTDYIVSYKSSEDSIDVSKKFRVSTMTSWLSLLFYQKDRLNKEEMLSRAGPNLIRSVLDDANIKK